LARFELVLTGAYAILSREGMVGRCGSEPGMASGNPIGVCGSSCSTSCRFKEPVEDDDERDDFDENAGHFS
jgi:hypothetical protein